MNTVFTPSNDFYRRILAQTDPDARRALYLELLVQPWKPMMDMLAGRMGGGDDPLAGARAWAWLLPDQVDEMRFLLDKLEAADAWGRGREALKMAAARFDPWAERIPFSTITGWLALADPARSNTYERGYTGAMDWTQPRFIGQFWDANADNLRRLPGLVAHEMHHLIRMSAFPFHPVTTSVADYIVIEGTAEAFAASLFGVDNVGSFVTDLDTDRLETARRLIGEGLERTGFDVIRRYIFGDEIAARWGFGGSDPTAEGPLGMPIYGGYATGYRVVRAFLERSGKTIEEATFLPASEIVAGSGYFMV